MLPDFNADGVLPVPPQVYTADWEPFSQRFGWSPRRLALLDGIQRVGRNLRGAGIPVVWFGGTFVTAKDDPGDFDGVWDPTTGSFDPAKIDPVLIDVDDLRNGRYRQKAKYGGELFHGMETNSGSAFQTFFAATRDEVPMGIVRLRLRNIP